MRQDALPVEQSRDTGVSVCSTPARTNSRNGPRNQASSGVANPSLSRRSSTLAGKTPSIARRRTLFVSPPTILWRSPRPIENSTKRWSRNGTRASMPCAMLFRSSQCNSIARFDDWVSTTQRSPTSATGGRPMLSRAVSKGLLPRCGRSASPSSQLCCTKACRSRRSQRASRRGEQRQQKSAHLFGERDAVPRLTLQHRVEQGP